MSRPRVVDYASGPVVFKNDGSTHPFLPLRSQIDSHEQNAAVGDACARTFPPDEDKTRQDAAADADVRVLLARYNGVPPQQQSPMFAEIDWDIGLSDLMKSRVELNEHFNRLPREVRARYHTWPMVVDAMQRGELTLEFKPVKAPEADSSSS